MANTATTAPATGHPTANAQAQAAAALAVKGTPMARTWAKIQALFKRGPVLALAVTTTAGDALTIDTGERTTPEVGDAVFMADGTPAPDETYTLEDGATVVVVGGLVSVYTAAPEASTTETPAEPTTLAEAQALITQLRAGATATASAPAAGGTVAPAATAPAAVPVTASAADNATAKAMANMQALVNSLGAMVSSGGTAPTALDTTNPANVARGAAGATASAVHDANSPEAKASALAAIRAQNLKKAQKRTN